MIDHNKIPTAFQWIKSRHNSLDYRLSKNFYEYTFMQHNGEDFMYDIYSIRRVNDGDYSIYVCEVEDIKVIGVTDTYLFVSVPCPLGTPDRVVKIPLAECYEMKQDVHPEHGYSRLTFIDNQEGGE